MKQIDTPEGEESSINTNVHDAENLWSTKACLAVDIAWNPVRGHLGDRDFRICRRGRLLVKI